MAIHLIFDIIKLKLSLSPSPPRSNRRPAKAKILWTLECLVVDWHRVSLFLLCWNKLSTSHRPSCRHLFLENKIIINCDILEARKGAIKVVLLLCMFILCMQSCGMNYLNNLRVRVRVSIRKDFLETFNILRVRF